MDIGAINAKLLIGGAISAFLFFICISTITSHGKLTKLRNNARKQWGLVDIDLTARYELIAKLVEVAKTHAEQETEVFDAVEKARTAALTSLMPSSKLLANEALTGPLDRLIKLSEKYEALKNDAEFQKLRQELSNVDARILASKGIYGLAADKYKKAVSSPSNKLVAKLFGFDTGI